MSFRNQGASLSSSADRPAKLKCGHPLEDESVQGGNTHATPETGNLNRYKQSMWIGNPASTDMLGQMVSGVVEGSFDTGYLLNVKVADTNVHLRGVVFRPGLVSPVTGANDVAPHAKMYRRKYIPVPTVNIQGRLHVASPPSGKSEKPIKRKNDASNISDQVLHIGLQPGASVASDSQSASVIAPPASNLPINESSLSLGQRVMQVKFFDSGLHNEKAVGQHQSLQGFEEPVSAKVATSFLGSETINLKRQVEHQDLSSDLKQKKLVDDDVKRLDVDSNKSPEISEPEPQAMACDTGINKLDKKASSRQDIDISEDTRLVLAQKITNGAKMSHMDVLSASDDITTTTAAPFSAFMTNLPITIFGEETSLFDPVSAAEESVIPTMVIPEVNSSAMTGDSYSVESNVNDAIPPPHS